MEFSRIQSPANPRERHQKPPAAAEVRDHVGPPLAPSSLPLERLLDVGGDELRARGGSRGLPDRGGSALLARPQQRVHEEGAVARQVAAADVARARPRRVIVPDELRHRLAHRLGEHGLAGREGSTAQGAGATEGGARASHSRWISPRASPTVTASVRSATPSLAKMFLRWILTVSSMRPMALATSLLLNPDPPGPGSRARAR